MPGGFTNSSTIIFILGYCYYYGFHFYPFCAAYKSPNQAIQPIATLRLTGTVDV
jgi:hypothetical protein